MAGYIGSRASVVSSGAERKKTFDITTTTTALTGLSYTPTFVHLFHNGVRLVDGTDYTATSGTSITLTTAAQSGDQVVVVSYATFQAADAYTKAETYTKAEADAGFVSVAGDTMTGSLSVGGAGPFSSKLSVKTNGVEDALVLYHPSITTGAKILFADNIYNAAIRSTPDGVGKTGLAFDVHQSEKMRIDSSGRVTTPSQPSFFVCGNSGWVTTAAGGIVPLGVTTVNIGNNYNLGNYAYTAPVSGSYQINLHAYINGTAQGVLKKNGSDYIPTDSDTAFILFPNSSSATSSVSGVIYLNAGDYIQLGARNAQSLYIYTGHSSFSGYLIG